MIKLHVKWRTTEKEASARQHIRREIALRNNRRHYVIDHGDRSNRCCRINDDHGDDDRRPSLWSIKANDTGKLQIQILNFVN